MSIEISTDERVYPFQADAYLKRVSRGVEAVRFALRDKVQGFVDDSHGPFLEVAGPSRRGYATLEGVTFRNGLAITNYYGGDPIRNPYNVDVRADVRNLPIASKSLGGLAVSYLTIIPTDIESERFAAASNGMMDMGRIMQSRWLMQKALLGLEIGDNVFSDKATMRECLRLSMLKEARRTLTEGGIYVVRGETEAEPEIAASLGFERVLSVMRYDGDYPDEKQHESLGIKQAHYGHTERLYRLSDLNTPAGKYIESL